MGRAGYGAVCEPLLRLFESSQQRRARFDHLALVAGPGPEPALMGTGGEVVVGIGVGQGRDRSLDPHLPPLVGSGFQHQGARLGGPRSDPRQPVLVRVDDPLGAEERSNPADDGQSCARHISSRSRVSLTKP